MSQSADYAQWQSRSIYRTGVTPEEVAAFMAEPPPEKASIIWPDPLAAAAFRGIAGEIVRKVEPHTESDPAALLIQLIVGFGNLIGRGAFAVADGSRHWTNLFAAIVGVTSKGRKGTATAHVKNILQEADSSWLSGRTKSGLSSGEGLIWQVRDAIKKQEPVKQRGRVIDYQTVIEDPGISDKRLLVIEHELASALRVMERHGSTLSTTIRDAWDVGDLRVMTKNNPAQATGAHISIIGHITRDELLRYLNATESANGFANRFLWVCARRSKELPEGGAIRDVDFSEVFRELREVAASASVVREFKRDAAAKDLWADVYGKLSEGGTGLLGCATGRAEAQVLRLSLIYALLDGSHEILTKHLISALAVWKYCEDSARFIFGDAIGDPVADAVLAALRDAPEGLTRTEINSLFGRNRKSSEIANAVTVLLASGLAARATEMTGGRPVERWVSMSRGTKAAAAGASTK